MDQWNIIKGDYTEDRTEIDPYTIVKRNQKLKRFWVNVSYIIFSSVLFIAALEIVTLVIK